MRYARVTGISFLLAFAFLCLSKNANATDISIKGKPLHGKDTTLVVNGVISVADTVLLNSPGWSVRNVKNLVTLKIDEFSNLLLPDSFKLTVIYSTDYKVWPSASLQTRYDTAVLLYNKNTPYINRVISARPGIYSSSVTITSITSNYASAPLSSFIKSIMLENEIQSSRDFTNFDCNTNAVQTLNINTDSVSDNGELIITWPSVLEADEYDLEWSVIDQSALPNYNISSSNTNPDPLKIFENNATRVSLGSNQSSYRVPLIYEKGTILFIRIRSVQVLVRGQRKEAFWSSAFSNGLKRFDITGGLEPSKNWQSTTSFAEEGKRKSVVQFYDGSLRSRQTVTKDNVRNTTVVAETFYDYQGRAQIQVLPSPTLNRIIAYTPNFNPATNGYEYDKEHFDKSITLYCNSGADPLGTSSGAGKYYSDQNPEKTSGINKFIPDAKGYPFTETKYTQDATGRISEQGGVGPYHQLGQAVTSDVSSAGHQTKYYYNTADQEDLDALFGTDVGNASHYFKNTVKDANGQYSVSYVDMHGRTIATALAGTPSSTKLDKISSNTTRWETKNLLSGGNLQKDKYTVQSTKSFTVTKDGLYSFNYSLLGDSITIEDCKNIGICYDCQYDLEITITNECNGTPTVYKKSNFTLADFMLSPDITCNALHNIIWQKDTVLTEGSYIITKTLMLNRQAMEAYKQQVFLPHNTCKTLQEFIDEKATAILNSIGCETTCQQCTDSIGTWENYRQKFMRKLSISVLDSAAYRDAAWQSYQSEVEECDALCEKDNIDKDILQQMLDDVTPPAGQYANDVHSDGSAAYQWSIFHTDFVDATKRRYQASSSDFLEANGSLSLINGLKPQQLTAKEFADNFRDSWAKTLLPLHPEYKRYLRLIKFKSSLRWDTEFNNTDTYAAAIAKGYLNPTGNTTSVFTVFDPTVTTGISRDPFYQICLDSFSVPVSTNKTLMESYMKDISAGTVNGSIAIWNMATISAKCREEDPGCQNNYKSANAFNATQLCTGDLDMAWKAYQGMYMTKKKKLMYDIVAKAPDGVINPAVPNTGISGDDELHVLNIQAPEDIAATSSIGGSASSGEQYRDNGITQLRSQIGEACQSYVAQWMKDLGTCNYSEAQKTALTQQLLAVCNAGGDESHPMGASTVSPTSTYSPKSFDQVVKDFNTANGITTNINCNADLITTPLPYDAQGLITATEEVLTGAPEPCLCEKINTLYTSFTTNSLGTANFSEYIRVKLNTDISESDLTILRNLCNTSNDGSCNNLSVPIAIPVILQCNNSGCINCSDMQQYYNEFKLKYSSVLVLEGSELTAEQQNINKVFLNFMNKRTGLNKTLSEYLSFMATCNTDVNVSARCDSMQDILTNFKDFYSTINFSQIYQNWKITSCSNKLLDATNALIIANNNPGNSIFGSNGYAKTPYSANFDVKLKSITTNGLSGFDQPDIFNSAILPLDLDCSVLPVSITNSSFYQYNILKENIVYANEFVLGTAPQNELGNKPLYAASTAYHNEYLKLIFADKVGAGGVPAFDYNAYGAPTPLSKYIYQNANSGLEGHLYDFAVINPLSPVATPAQYDTYLNNYFTNNQIVRYYPGDTIHPYIYTKGIALNNVKRLYNLRFDNGILSQTSIPAGDISPKYLICSIEYNSGTIGTGYLYNHNQPGLIAYKEAIDTNLYNPDCKKSFTAYYNGLKNTAYTYHQIDSLYAINCGISLNPCGTSSCDSLQLIVDGFQNYVPGNRPPALDSSGCDTTNWKINEEGWFHTPKYRLADFIQNGVMAVPSSDQETHKPNFNYVNNLCLNGGVTVEARFKFDFDSSHINHPYANIYYASSAFEIVLNPDENPQYIRLQFNQHDPSKSWATTDDNKIRTIHYPVPELGVNSSVWHTYKVVVRDNLYSIFIDNVLKKTFPYTGPINKFSSWGVSSYGEDLKLDWFKIYDENDNLKYDENFNGCNAFGIQSLPKSCSVNCQQNFTDYFNSVKHTNYSYRQIDSIYMNSCGKHAGPCGNAEPTLCATPDSVPAYGPLTKCELAVDGATDWGTQKYNAYTDSLTNVFEERYLAKCMNIFNRETFTMSDSVSEYHYTLYYYDQAGNLVKTVPPEGVNLTKMNNKLSWSNTVSAARINGNYLPVLHGVVTQYRYNSLNQVVQQSSPDGGVSNFWYDRLGRLVTSQNAKQKNASSTEAGKNYSYTLYDGIGRITEVGEYTNPGSATMTQLLSRDADGFNTWLGTNANKKQVTRTVYDIANTNWNGVPALNIPVIADNLRNRVAYTQYYPLGNPNGVNYSQATYYSYDIHGNVDTLIQDYGNASLGTGYVNIMNNNGYHNRFKRMVYQYDLISGKVNHVAFQPQYIKSNILYRPSDAVYHQYKYDAENRLISVYTSTDSIVWENDATYDYYKHGPLARTELGEQKVQGIDYAYTIQGWLKGVNSISLTHDKDMGEDGNTSNPATRYVARDAFGFTLNYFNNDYSSIAAGAGTNSFPLHSVASGVSGGVSNTDYRPLYNGNISSMAVNIGKLSIPDATGTGVTNGAILYNYAYDQLNRLTAMNAFKGLTAANNSWANIVSLQQYQERITYDGNGNIKTYKRNGNKSSQLLMDDLSYSYNLETAGDRINLISNNKLRNVRDAITNTAAYAETDPATGVSDIEDQNGSTDNYGYDAIGNMVKDDKENITLINWNVYGKISDINFAFVANKTKKITYLYDATGNRICKQVEKYGTNATATNNQVTYSWYVRDASGNVMAVYSSKSTGTTIPATLDVIERHLYGSSRLGIISQTINVKTLAQMAIGTMYSGNFTRGNKFFELTNHLGNVLATISDRKVGVPNGGNTAIDYYTADVITANDYYPGGMIMPGRKYSQVNVKYRYGFSGKENDNDIKGEGNAYDYGARILDPRLGRWLSVDPLQQKYTDLSSYQYCANSPISAKDPDGRLIIFINGMWGAIFGIKEPKESYWGSSWVTAVQRRIEGKGSKTPLFYDGAIGGQSRIFSKPFQPKTANTEQNRIAAGEQAGYHDAAAIIGSLDKGETIKLVTNSMGAAFERGFTKGILKYQAEENERRTTFNSEIETQVLLLTAQRNNIAAGLDHVPIPETTSKNEEIYKQLNSINSKISSLDASKKQLLNVRLEMNIDLSSHETNYPDPNVQKSFFMMAAKMPFIQTWGGLGVSEKPIGGNAVQIGLNPNGTSQMSGHYGPLAPPAAMPESDTKPKENNP